MLFIVNPISGKSRKEKIVTFLKKEGCKVVYTEYAGHAEELARNADEGIIVAVGGDGTVNEVARGIIGTDKVLGIIPCGSGDGLALHLGISRYYKQAYRTIRKGKQIKIDSATINGKAFFSICGLGFDAEVSEKFAKSGKRGLVNYIKQGVKIWSEYKPSFYTIDIDGRTLKTEAAIIAIGNSNQWGNRAMITPRADIGDGMLDITIVDMFKNIEIPTLAILLMTGRINSSNRAQCHKGCQIIISRSFSGPVHADGDWFNAGKEVEIKINPQSLNVIIP